MPIIIIGPSSPTPIGSDDAITFHTFRGYLEAVCARATALHPQRHGLVAGVAQSVKAKPWRLKPGLGKVLSPRAGEKLRNAWATEVLLNAPRTLGGGDLVSFANLWAPVQAYYAVFNAFGALADMLTPTPPLTHAKLLTSAATAAAATMSPFVPPWTARVGGPPGAWAYLDFGPAPLDLQISNLKSVHAGNAPSLLAMALRTTRRAQIADSREGWIRAQPPTKADAKRKTLASVTISGRLTTGQATAISRPSCFRTAQNRYTRVTTFVARRYSRLQGSCLFEVCAGVRSRWVEDGLLAQIEVPISISRERVAPSAI